MKPHTESRFRMRTEDTTNMSVDLRDSSTCECINIITQRAKLGVGDAMTVRQQEVDFTSLNHS